MSGATEPRFDGGRGAGRAALQRLAHVAFERALVLGRSCNRRQRIRPPHEPKRRHIDSGPHARITTLHADERGDRHTETAHPCALRLTAPDTRDGEVLTQRAQRRRRHAGCWTCGLPDDLGLDVLTFVSLRMAVVVPKRRWKERRDGVRTGAIFSCTKVVTSR